MFRKDVVKKKMDDLGWSQYDLAKKVYVSQPMIAGIMLGYKQPSLQLAARIADVLDCTIDELVEE